jgi:hypothetical protein
MQVSVYIQLFFLAFFFFPPLPSPGHPLEMFPTSQQGPPKVAFPYMLVSIAICQAWLMLFRPA